MLLGLVAEALWMYRAYHNEHQLSLASYSKSMAAWSWFVPILNIWLHYRIM
ncbi:DUF4328 domain-containing protein [Hymenobacter sp. BT594]|uniref:DUF4328 domain-containing protein n=2 Tax=Hymenobacter guriensis TaxID=2793065 RepID=A0ABS0L040_9BACT|nr:DUF4328 domain-containing protein [Hymenobacter guriensis]